MNAIHDANHEAVLQRWAAREELSAEERALLDGCETCSRRRDEIEAVAAELEELGDAERDAEIDAARRADAPDWEERALSTLERTMQGDRAGRPQRPRKWVVIGLVAAAAIVVTFVFPRISGRGPDPVEPFWLEQEGVTDMAPAGEVERVEAFSWTHETPPLGSYELRLYLPGESNAFHSATIYEPRWSPDLSDPLPEHFFWELRALDAEGDEVASGRAEVRVSPP